MKASTKTRFRHLWDLAVVICSIGILSFTWSTHSDNLGLEKRLSELRSQMVKPYLLNGFQPELDSFSLVYDEWGQAGMNAGFAEPSLLVALSDNCRFSQQALQPWMELLDDVGARHISHLTIISMDGTELAGNLAAKAKELGVPFVVRLVTDRALFSFRTGISAVPMTVLLDSSSSIRMAGSGALGALERQLLEAEMAGQSLQSPFFQSAAALGVTFVRNPAPSSGAEQKGGRQF